MADGLNIATKAGEGDASILNWKASSDMLEKVYRRDIVGQKQREASYNRSAMSLENNAKSIRKVDLPKYQENYGKWKQSSAMLMNPSVSKNPSEFSKWSTVADNLYTDMLNYAEVSKKTAQDIVKKRDYSRNKNGAYDTPFTHTRLDSLENTPTDDIMKNSLLDDGNLFYSKSPVDEKKFNDLTIGAKSKMPSLNVDLPNNQYQTYNVVAPKNVSLKKGADGLPLLKDGKPTFDFGGVVQATIKSMHDDELNQNHAKISYDKATTDNPNIITQAIQKAQELVPEYNFKNNPEDLLIARQVIAAYDQTDIGQTGAKEKAPTFAQKAQEYDRRQANRQAFTLQMKQAGLSDNSVNRLSSAVETAIGDRDPRNKIAVYDNGKRTGEFSIVQLGDKVLRDNSKVKIDEKTGRTILTPADHIAADNNGNLYSVFVETDKNFKKTKKVESYAPIDPATLASSIYTNPKKEQGLGKAAEVYQNLKNKLLGGNKNKEAAAPKKTINKSDIATKAAAAGYTAKEYEALLIKNGVTIK